MFNHEHFLTPYIDLFVVRRHCELVYFITEHLLHMLLTLFIYV
jgi:hypothetical protein